MKIFDIFKSLTNSKKSKTVEDRKEFVTNLPEDYLNFDSSGNIYISDEKVKIFDDINTDELKINIRNYKNIDLSVAAEEQIYEAAL